MSGAIPPLTPVVFEILLSLARDTGPRHGYAIMKDVEERTNGELVLRPGTLYRAAARLLEDGWIAEAEAPAVEGEDERRRYYRLTPTGRVAAANEARRLDELVHAARARRLLEGRVS